MAKRKPSTSTQIVRAVPVNVRAPAPIIRVQAPRAAPHKKKGHRRRHSGSSSLSQQSMTSHALGGVVYGFIEKNFGKQLPTLPLVGRAGSIAIAAYMLAKGRSASGIVGDVARAAAVIAGYQLGTTGAVAGPVAGIAAQV